MNTDKLPYDVLRPAELEINLTTLREGWSCDSDDASARIRQSHKLLITEIDRLRATIKRVEVVVGEWESNEKTLPVLRYWGASILRAALSTQDDTND